MKIADPILMREINKFHVLEAIRMTGKISRIEISEKTFLSGTTVSTITGALIDEGLVGAVHTQPIGQSGRGRPRVLLELIAEAAFSIGVIITQRKTFATVANFRGELVHSLSLPVGISRWGKDVVIDIVEDTVRECVSKSGVDASRIKGIGIGTFGLNDPKSNEPNGNVGVSDYDVSIGQELTNRLNLAVKIERTANLIALAEGWFEPGGRERALTVITIDEKVDIGCIVGGDIYRGTSGLGLAFGQTRVHIEEPATSVTQTTTLDGLFSRSASLAAAAQQNGSGEDPIEARDITNLLAERAVQNDDAALAFFSKQGDALGQAISHLVNLVNPHQVLIYFRNSSQKRFVENAFFESLSRNAESSLLNSVEITFRNSSDEDSLRGAVALMLQDIYNSPWTMR